MSDKEKKYLEDEQVRKNIDSFKNDRENFMNNSETLDILGINYGTNNHVKESYRIDKEKDLKNDEKVKKEVIGVKENIDSNGNNVIKKKSSYILIPIILSIFIVIYYFIKTIGFSAFTGIDNVGALLGAIFVYGFIYIFSGPFADSVVICMFIWFFYIMWFLVKKLLLRDGKNCEIKSLFISVGLIIIFLSLVTILDRFY